MPFPRKGQWVKLAKEMQIDGKKEPAGTVGIVVGDAMREYDPKKDGPLEKDEVPPRVPIGEGALEVHLVDHPQGTTRLKVVLYADDLDPVLNKSELPKDRVKTMHPDFKLRA